VCGSITCWFRKKKEILTGTGWELLKILSDKGPGYTAIMTKTRQGSPRIFADER
jgi:hypothetical protein